MANAGSAPVVQLMARLAATRGPVLTWYSVTGARVELTGAVLVQWAAKVAHLLLDLGAEPGEQVRVDLGADWRAPSVWLATWWDGLSLADPVTGRPDYLVVREDRLDAARTAGVAADRLVVVASGALSPQVAHLPRGATDFAGVRSFPDQAPPAAEESGAIAELGGDGPGGAGPVDPAGRTMLGPDAGPRELASVWSRGGSVVWHDGLTGEALARVVRTEGVG